jgi:hypothetical protein
MVDWSTIFLAEKAQMAIAGTAGGVVRWLTLREGIRDGAISVVVGAICAMYLGPAVVPILEPAVGKLTADPAARIGLSCFFIGLGGVGASGFFIDLWRARKSLVSPSKRRPKDDDDDVSG